jgi:hypothetical protein
MKGFIAFPLTVENFGSELIPVEAHAMFEATMGSRVKVMREPPEKLKA